MIEFSLIIRSVVGLQLLSLKDMRSFLDCFHSTFHQKFPGGPQTWGK